MPPPQTLTELLNALHTDALRRPATVRLRSRLTLIEQALAAGATLQSVRDALAAEGLDLPFNTFTSALRRLRLANGPKPVSGDNSNSASPQAATPAPPSHADPAVTDDAPTAATPPAHDPRELDRIINSVPDLDALARAHKASRKKAP